MLQPSLVIITGTSGSGKATALGAFEDMGYFCVSNLPASLISRFVENVVKANVSGAGVDSEQSKFALLVDCRDADSFSDVTREVEAAKNQGLKTTVLFLDAQDQTIFRRFQETRRPHPLLVAGRSVKTLPEALVRERELLSSVRGMATHVIDTTSFSPHDLKRLIEQFVDFERKLRVRFLSFGFKHGVPGDADLVVDVRFISNPYFQEGLREKTGEEKEVQEFVMSSPQTEKFLEHYEALLRFLIPQYQQEGKSYLTVAVGCTGGRHRSVVMVNFLAKRLSDLLDEPSIKHRDLG